MKWLKLCLCLLFFVPVCALLGGLSTLDSRVNPWVGLAVGAIVGVFFGLVFGGNSDWKIWDFFFGPKPEEKEEEG